MKTLRVLHCPTTIGGNPQGLARAERELGLESRSVTFQTNYLKYQADEVLSGPNEHRALLEVKRWELLWRALWHYEVIHFNSGQSILPYLLIGEFPNRYPGWVSRLTHLYARLLDMNDIAWLHYAGKGIAVTFQGDDARQGDYSLANFEISIAQEVDTTYYTPEGDRLKRRIISKFARYADRIFYLNPDLGHVLPSRAVFMPYGHLDLRQWQPVATDNKSVSDRPVVIHAPTQRQVKGTPHILEAVKKLQAEGLVFDFVLVEGLAHDEARRLYERADLLIDQLLAGWYGGLAVELMALGKPVMCYIREGDLKFIPEQMRQELPLINVTPSTLCDVLREWLTVSRHKLPQVGQRSRAFVEHWHDSLKIAANLKAEYETIIKSKQERNSAKD